MVAYNLFREPLNPCSSAKSAVVLQIGVHRCRSVLILFSRRPRCLNKCRHPGCILSPRPPLDTTGHIHSPRVQLTNGFRNILLPQTSSNNDLQSSAAAEYISCRSPVERHSSAARSLAHLGVNQDAIGNSLLLNLSKLLQHCRPTALTLIHSPVDRLDDPKPSIEDPVQPPNQRRLPLTVQLHG